ncbi:hypothetical protein HF521_000912 [Silurus meridionalis]|uniref:Ig-like domain-containing protein n=1 Tax=Silurus meridionalis TaxID=175797 RepID=A0A8T0BX52_SILME|nr:hypothetical protein HF521_000912 [Silurus meridionalis]
MKILLLIFTLCLISAGSSKSREVTAYAGTRSNIKCRYEDQYKNKPKSFWKIRTDQWSIKHIKTEPHSEWSHDGRFSIHDNRSAGFFSVFIRELIIEDTGTYACAVAASDRIEIYTVVQLNVTEDLQIIKNEDYEDMHRLQSAQNTNPTESVYYSLNPNTNQSDSVYQSLNPNTNQSDSVYQSLNPNTNQSDSVYQSLNPNQSDSVYQSLNPNQSD